MIAISPGRAAAPKTLESGTPGHMFAYVCRDYLGPAPQAFLVELGAGVEIPPHFHRVDEFQVVMAGDGSLGKHAIAPVTAHFAEAYTPYGPIRVGEHGLAFFTLRAAHDAGALYMPGSRAQLIRKARRNVAGGAPLGAARPADTSPPPGHGGVTPLIEPHADGLAAWLVSADGGAAIAVPAGTGGGRYYLVAAGDVDLDGERLLRWSCVWTGPDDSPPALAAGAAGAHVVILQFPLSEAGAR
ncbi:MAG: hypothetical protein HY216_03665 [Candidatus Rokubacteria bacterium]|nr:hypothetical protein [Candidatus Rokubacteria bacterium]